MKPLLSLVHRQRRQQWVRDNLRWTPQPWAHVVFSDEARFEVYRKDGRIRVRRQTCELVNEDCIRPRVQLVVGASPWGAFHAGEKSELVVLEGYLDQH